MSRSKIRWGDTLDDEEALPPTTVKGPDSHGIKIITEYYKNDKGEAIKKLTKVKVVNVEKKVYKVGVMIVFWRQRHSGRTPVENLSSHCSTSENRSSCGAVAVCADAPLEHLQGMQ